MLDFGRVKKPENSVILQEMPTPLKLYNYLGFAIVIVGIAVTSRADINDDVFSDEQRLQGFREHEKDAEKFDDHRLSGLEEYRQNKKKGQAHSSEEAIREYKAEKSKVTTEFQEGGPAYKKNLLEREAALVRIENLRLAFVHLKEVARRQRNRNILLTDDHELGLDQKAQRVDLVNRLMYGGKSMAGYIAGGAAKTSGDVNSSRPTFQPPPDFNTYEPPPPPIPYDESSPPPPPPMFDEPEF